MDHYDLRTCFLPDLSGLHVRIYQFRELLRHNLPALSAHLEELQVDPAYVSQWFLSFFAVTCPLPMLFRIYDVIFAEGASETLMRVALSLMRKNEQRLLSCTELEDVMQLLLSRGLWDCYHYDADEFVQDFVSLTSEVSREKLGQLEKGYRDSLVATANATRSSAITNAATRFLGRIWASSAITSPKIATLSPGLSAPARPLSMLRRSTSKQSLASTLNSMEASSSSVTSSNSTDASSVSRDSARSEEESSSRESTPVGPKSTANPKTVEDNYLHSQIEDLLTALSELQRNHAVLSDQLQQEREERQEDHEMVQTLLTGLRAKGTSEPGHIPEGSLQAPDERNSTPTPADNVYEGEKRTDDNEVDVEVKAAPSTEDLSELLERVEARFASDKSRRLSSMAKSKSQLQDDLALAKDQLACAMSQSQDYSRQINDLSQEVASVRDQLRESHAHVRSLHQDKQRLEKQVHGMRSRSSAMSASEVPSRDQEADWPGKNKKGGLREFKLARSKSSPSQGGFTSRLSSLSTNQEPSTAGSNGLAAPAITTTESSSTEQDLLHELVQAKTAEAVAKQEAEEAKQKLEALRKAYGLSPADTPPAAAPGGPGAVSVFGRLTGQGAVPVTESSHKPAASTSSVSAGGGGFWGWRR
jgi:septal ring factor EnvC (AmiA/AmiB activator)